jgi:hypothetical protein
MPSTKTKAKAGAKGTRMLVKHPKLRRAAKPTAKLGWRLKGRKAAQKTAKNRVLPALAIGVAMVAAAVLLELGWARRRKASDEAPDATETPSAGESQTAAPTSLADAQP